MPLHLSARLHAAAHGLFRPKDEKIVRALYDKVAAQFQVHGLETETGRDRLISNIGFEVASQFGLEQDDERNLPIIGLTKNLFDYEGLFLLPDVDWSQKHTVAEYWDIRDALTFQQSLVGDFETTRHLLQQAVGMLVQQLYEACPTLYDGRAGDDGISIKTHLLQSIGDIGAVTEAMQPLPKIWLMQVY